MKAIHADPQTVRKVFTEKYIVPDFQRPYSWTIDQCDKLWEDLIDFYNGKNSRDDRYFLGNLVIHPTSEAFSIIDGQQRLTTLLLLIKALHQKAGVVKALEECIKLKNPLTSELTNELRISSNVLAQDREQLNDLIFYNGVNTPDNSKLKTNLTILSDKLGEWWNSVGNSTDKLNELILVLLDQIVLLPIHCSSEDDALIIFETINDRGMSLNDADIFKAKLHRNAGPEKDEFIKTWNSLTGHEWFFRIYMHILRAQADDAGKEGALRAFFSQKDRLKNWRPVMSTICKVNEANNTWEASDEVEILWKILQTYPNHYWNFPQFVFLNKYGRMNDGVFELPTEFEEAFAMLLRETCKFFFIKGVVHNSVNAVKDTAFKVCAIIEKGDDATGEYQKSSEADLEEFFRRIENRQYGRYQNGLVLLSGYLNPDQDKALYRKILKGEYHIEHILPKKWNHYDKWTAESWEKNLNTLGNLTPLEWKLNISARNEFFMKKKEYYKKSGIQDVTDLMSYDDWHPADFDKRHLEAKQRIAAFFQKSEGESAVVADIITQGTIENT